MQQILTSNSNAIATEPAPPQTPPKPAVAEPIIRVGALGKRFKLYPSRWGRVVEWLTLGRAVRHQDFWALRDINFEVVRGQSLGIIGVNGSGKSTLLKILSGAMYATQGKFDVRGRVLSLLELGTGLNPELTGRQNVINSARLLGFPANYATQKMGQIEAFAELGEFFDRSVRLYSSGMLVRLSFSMFGCFDPEIFIIDEALSVGDVFFQQKCARRIQEMRENGTTMLLVSHDLAAVEALCDRVLVLHGGRVRHDGDKKSGIRLYYALGGAALDDRLLDGSPRQPAHVATGRVESERISDPIDGVPAPQATLPTADELPWQAPDARDAFGDGQLVFDGICFRREGGRHDPVVEQGQWIEVFALIRAVRDAPACNIGFALYDRMNRLMFARGWVNAELPPVDFRAGDRAVARFTVKLDVEPGEYIASFGSGRAIPDEFNPSGWNQHVAADRYAELPHAAVIAVVPRRDRRRVSFGPANLASRLDRIVLGSASEK